MVIRRPLNLQIAARQAHAHRAMPRQQPRPHAGHRRRTRARAAGLGFARAAFKHAQPDMVRIQHLHKTQPDTGQDTLTLDHQGNMNGTDYAFRLTDIPVTDS